MANLYHKGNPNYKPYVVECAAKARLCARLMVEYGCCDALPPHVVDAANKYTRLLKECETAKNELDHVLWPNGWEHLI